MFIDVCLCACCHGSLYIFFNACVYENKKLA